MKKSSIVAVLDTVSLINLLERVTSRDLIAELGALGFSFHIVESVYREYAQKPKEPGLARFSNFAAAGTVRVIPEGDITVRIDLLAQWSALGDGEKVSALYVLDHPDLLLVSDDKAAHLTLMETCRIRCHWTTMLLDELIDRGAISHDEASTLYAEMKKNGFRGMREYRPTEKKEKE